MAVRRAPSLPARVVVLAVLLSIPSARTLAQNRGVYPLGMSAVSSGVVPEPGLTYANAFLFYSRDESKGPDGETIATGSNSVLMDMNTFSWVSKARIEPLGGAKISLSATIPIANNSLTSDSAGALSGGGGLADSFYQPFVLGWTLKQADLRFAYGFLAPTGKFHAGASDNVGSGYWTQTLSAGGTFYMPGDRTTAVSAFGLYEFHSEQEGTGIHPGQTMSLDYSITRTIPLRPDFRLQVGLAGYEQWQTTDKSGPDVTPAEAGARYRVNSVGIAANVILPERRVSLGAKFFKEFSNRSTYEGYAVQITGAVTF